MAKASEIVGFFDIPCEARDEIYRHYFPSTYSIPGSRRCHEFRHSMVLLRPQTFHDPSNSRILQVSQKMRFEAGHILYHDSVFGIWLDGSERTLISQGLAN